MKNFMFILCLLVTNIAFATDVNDIDDIYNKWKENYASKDLTKTSWSCHNVSFVPSKKDPDWKPYENAHIELTINGSKQKQVITGYFRTPGDANAIKISDSNVLKLYRPSEKALTIARSRGSTHSVNDVANCMLLMPDYSGRKKFEFEALWEPYAAQHKITIVDTNNILGYQCVHVKIGQCCDVWFAPDLGMMPVDYIRLNMATMDVYEEFHVQSIGKIGNWYYPKSTIWRTNSPNFGDSVRLITTDKIEFGTQTDLDITLPPNTRIYDVNSHMVYYNKITDFNLIKNIGKVKQ